MTEPQLPESQATDLDISSQWNVFDTPTGQAIYINLPSQTVLTLLGLTEFRYWLKSKVGCEVVKILWEVCFCSYTVLQLNRFDEWDGYRRFNNPATTALLKTQLDLDVTTRRIVNFSIAGRTGTRRDSTDCQQLGQILLWVKLIKATRRELALVNQQKWQEYIEHPSEEPDRDRGKQAKESMFLVDMQTKRLVKTNVAFQRLLGYTAEEALELNLNDVVVPNRDIDRNIQHILMEKHHLFGEQQYRHKYGFPIDVEVRLDLTTFQGVEALCIAAHDITERKQAETVLKEREARLWALAEVASSAIFVYQNEQLRYVNAAAEFVSGYTREELLAMNIWDLVDPQVLARVSSLEQWKPVLLQHELELVTKGGEERCLKVIATLTEFEGFPAIVGTVVDITDRRQTRFKPEAIAL